MIKIFIVLLNYFKKTAISVNSILYINMIYSKLFISKNCFFFEKLH